VRVVEQSKAGKPFFLYLAFTAPHAPYQAPKEALDRYAAIADPSRRAYAAMITSMDDEIGRVLRALESRKLRDNTLIIYQSDNGGPASAMFTGEVDMSKGTIPPDNGPYREGKGTLYEGGTRVIAVASWPGHIVPGSTVNQPMHIVDMLPTLSGLAGAPSGGHKPLDGMDMWPTISEGKPSPRKEVVYDIEPFRAALRSGDWKLVWKATLPSKVELFDLARDPEEKVNLAGKNAAQVAEMKERLEVLSRDAVPPLLLMESVPALKNLMMSTVALPDDARAVEDQP
jgi:arylsulfatase B